MGCSTPQIFKVVVIFNVVGFHFLRVEFWNKFIEILFRHNCVFRSSEKMCLEGKFVEMFQAVGLWFLLSINFHIFLFSMIEPLHWTISKAVNPLQNVIRRGSSWFLRQHHSKIILGNLIFLAESAKHSDKVHDKIRVKFAVVCHDTDRLRKERWENKKSLQT